MVANVVGLLVYVCVYVCLCVCCLPPFPSCLQSGATYVEVADKINIPERVFIIPMLIQVRLR